MITRRTLEGALKCALRDFRREEWSAIRRKNHQHLFRSFAFLCRSACRHCLDHPQPQITAHANRQNQSESTNFRKTYPGL